MSAIPLRRALGLNRRTLVVSMVVVSCTSLVVIGLMKLDVPNPTVRPSLHSEERSATECVSDVESRRLGNHTSRSNDTGHRRRTHDVRECNISNLTVLGRPLDKCATSEVANLAEKEDIYVSVKTTSKNHVSRMLPVLLTWFQTLHPEQVPALSYL